MPSVTLVLEPLSRLSFMQGCRWQRPTRPCKCSLGSFDRRQDSERGHSIPGPLPSQGADCQPILRERSLQAKGSQAVRGRGVRVSLLPRLGYLRRKGLICVECGGGPGCSRQGSQAASAVLSACGIYTAPCSKGSSDRDPLSSDEMANPSYS